MKTRSRSATMIPIELSANTPAVTFRPVDRSAWIKGAHVFVMVKPGEPVAAPIAAVGLDATVPPM